MRSKAGCTYQHQEYIVPYNSYVHWTCGNFDTVSVRKHNLYTVNISFILETWMKIYNLKFKFWMHSIKIPTKLYYVISIRVLLNQVFGKVITTLFSMSSWTSILTTWCGRYLNLYDKFTRFRNHLRNLSWRWGLNLLMQTK